MWPLSRESYPKQLLPLISGNTMLQETILRLTGMDVKSPIVVCNELHRHLIAQQLSEIGIKNPTIILEPMARNTAPAIAAACFYAQKSDPDSVVIVLPSDHNIKDVEAFRTAAKMACHEALSGSLVTFGILPTFAATGYGYIERSSGFTDSEISPIKKFVEKPDAKTAQKYLDSGNFFWNSGMFVFKAATFLEELKKINVPIYNSTKKSIENSKIDSNFIRLDKESFSENPSISIDYAVMEKTANGKVVPLDAGWSDVGSWGSLWEVSEKDENGNAFKGTVMAKNVQNSLVKADGRTVTVIGLSDIVIVDTKDTLLVANKSQSEKVKDIVAALKDAGNPIATKYIE